tara:strand:- start:11110 stop:11487 length:378 start_codon:yes stop_codon:yes gene_type:complete
MENNSFMEVRENVIVNRSFDFSVRIIKFCYEMQSQHREYIITKQLLKSGTSIGANIEEAQGAISKKEFIAKTQISLKKAREFVYWIRLIIESQVFKSEKLSFLLNESKKLVYILTKILKSSKLNN